jgi:hypothetical protein
VGLLGHFRFCLTQDWKSSCKGRSTG